MALSPHSKADGGRQLASPGDHRLSGTWLAASPIVGARRCSLSEKPQWLFFSSGTKAESTSLTYSNLAAAYCSRLLRLRPHNLVLGASALKFIPLWMGLWVRCAFAHTPCASR